MTRENYNILKFIRYNELVCWDYNYFNSIKIKSKYKIVKIKDVINQESKKKQLYNFPLEKFDILGISNEIGMYDAYTQIGSNINQAYKCVEENFIAYNPYRINVGSIGIKTKDIKGNYISPAYVVFSCKKSINPEYLFLILKSSQLNNQIKLNTTGSVRQTLSFEKLCDMEIPLPELDIQNKIVEQYKEMSNKIKSNDELIRILEEKIELYLYKELGVTYKENKQELNKQFKILEFINYKDIAQWGVNKLLNNVDITSNKCNVTNLKENPQYYQILTRGKSPKYDENSDSIILNQKCNRLNYIDLSYAKNVNKNWLLSINKDFFTQKNDILINSTGEGTIGRASCIKGDENTNLMYDSHMLLLRLNAKYINPEYYTYLFNSRIVQSQIEILKGAEATKQTELGIENVKKIMLPLPEIEVQQKIVNYIFEIKEKINKLKIQSELINRQIEIYVNTEIFS